MNFKLIPVLFLSLTGLAHATPIQMGTFQLGACRVEIRPGTEMNTIDMRLDQGSHFASLNFDLRRERTNSFSGFYRNQYTMKTEQRHSDNALKYNLRIGGTWEAINAIAHFEFDRSTGLLKEWTSTLKVADISLPGMSIAPIKSKTDQLNCK